MSEGVRRAANSSLLGLVVAGGVIAGLVGLSSVISGEPNRRVVRGQVPNVVGLQGRDAVKALAKAGLVAEIQADSKAPHTGEVLRTKPSADVELGPGSTVLLTVAEEPMRPPAPPGVDPEERYTLFGGFVEGHPEIFVGYYIDESGELVVVFGPEVDLEAWRQRIEPHLGKGNEEYRMESCSHSLEAFQQIADQIEPSDFSHEIAFALSVDPATCTVRLESDLLTREDIRALVERFGTAVSFDTTEGNHPERGVGG